MFWVWWAEGMQQEAVTVAGAESWALLQGALGGLSTQKPNVPACAGGTLPSEMWRWRRELYSLQGEGESKGAGHRWALGLYLGAEEPPWWTTGTLSGTSWATMSLWLFWFMCKHLLSSPANLLPFLRHSRDTAPHAGALLFFQFCIFHLLLTSVRGRNCTYLFYIATSIYIFLLCPCYLPSFSM